MKTKKSIAVPITPFIIILCFLFLVFHFLSCQNNNPEKTQSNTPTTGEITISADKSFAPLAKAEADNFMAIYPQAKIHINFEAEADAIADFMNKKVSFIIVARHFNEEEINFLKQSDYPPRQIMIASDAVALIVNSANPDSNLRYEQVQNILNGKISDWSEIDKEALSEKIPIIFDNSKSSTLRFLKEELLKGDSLSPRVYSADSIEAVFEYVKKNPSSIGVVGISWFNSADDTIFENPSNGLRLVGISNPDSSRDIFYRPHQKYLLGRAYPLMRDLYVIHRQEGASLGAGFATYIASDEGQTIVQRSGLVPAHQPVRMIEIKNQF